MSLTPWKIVFLGTPQFAVPSLEALMKTEDILAVFTQPDRPQGRGQKLAPSQVKLMADKNSIPCFQPETLKNKDVFDQLLSLKPDLMVVVAYGLFLPPKILNIPTYKTLNVHPSLLPRYRGAAPLQWAIMNGDRSTGVTILYVTPEMDAGDMLAQKEVPLASNEIFSELHDRLSLLGAHLLTQVIQGLKKNTIQAIPQDPLKATFAPKLTKEDGKIFWDKPSQDIFNLIRGANPWPGTYALLRGEVLKILSASQIHRNFTGVAGRIHDLTHEGIVVETPSGCLLLTEVQKPNKRKMTAAEFLRGNPLKPGSFFDA